MWLQRLFSSHISTLTCFPPLQGTASTEAEELYDVYNLNVVTVPSRLPNQRIDHEARLYPDREAKYISLYCTVLTAYFDNRPVLIGTSSVTESEEIQKVLTLSWPWARHTKDNDIIERVKSTSDEFGEAGAISHVWKWTDFERNAPRTKRPRTEKQLPIG